MTYVAGATRAALTAIFHRVPARLNATHIIAIIPLQTLVLILAAVMAVQKI
jgi:hypothetical protein